MKSVGTVLLLIVVGLAGCTSNDATGPDADGDGLTNLEENQGWSIIVETMGKRIGRHVTSDPELEDTDGDGVPDRFEFAIGLDPRSKDTDEDGLTDCQEVFHTVVAECEDPDWQGEGDGGYGTFGHRADSDARVSRYWEKVGWVDELESGEPLMGDGISDFDEINGYEVVLSGNRVRSVVSDPLRIDSDDDGLHDGEELHFYTSDPTIRDTDGDGCDDGRDPVPDRHEAVLVDIKEMLWDAPGGSGSVDVVILAVIADQQQQFPQGTELIRLSHGVTNQLGGAEFAPLRPPECNYAPFLPYQVVSIQVWQPDPGQELEVSLDTVPNVLGQVWFNPQDGRFHWNARSPTTISEQPAFAAEGGLLTWSGPDGSVSFSVEVVELA